MNLKEYLFFKRMTVKEFSQIMDYSRTHMSCIVNGTATAGVKLAKKIENFTNGELKAIDLVKENDKRYKSRKVDVTNEDYTKSSEESLFDKLDEDVLDIIQGSALISEIQKDKV